MIRFTKYQLTQGVKTIWYVFYVPIEFLLTGGVKGILFHQENAQGTAWNTFLEFLGVPDIYSLFRAFLAVFLLTVVYFFSNFL